jgi:hypothetical protein
MEKPELHRMTFEFSQEANCVNKNRDYETLEIQCYSDLGIDYNGGFFMVLKTKCWSIDSIDDLKALVERIERVMEAKKADS